MAFPLDPARTFLIRALPWGDVGDWLNLHRLTAGGMPGRSFRDVAGMLEEIERLKRRFDVYCCMSSQEVAGERSAPNARFLKSLFLDVDVKDGAYASTADALSALNAFVHAVGLPPPTFIVLTGGGGFHCHWIFDEPLAKADWLMLAKALKNAVKEHGLILDTCVIADAARVLRIPGTVNHKYAARPPVILDPSIVARDYALAEIAEPLAPYMRAGATRTAGRAAAGADGQSKLLDGVPCDCSDFGARPIDFGEFGDAVMFLCGRGWFREHQYHHMRDLIFACAYVEITDGVLAGEACALVEVVVAAAGRVPERNARIYEKALDGTRARIAAGEEIVTPATVFYWAREQGWAPPGAAPGGRTAQAPVFTPAIEIGLAMAKASARDAYKLGRLTSRESALQRLAKFCATVDVREVRRELAKTVAVLLASDGWPFNAILDAGTFLGLEPPSAASLARWAVRKPRIGAAP
jgi:hypothetical protein